nr:hypothetical protein [Cupriavidus pinatubonensis]
MMPIPTPADTMVGMASKLGNLESSLNGPLERFRRLNRQSMNHAAFMKGHVGKVQGFCEVHAWLVCQGMPRRNDHD